MVRILFVCHGNICRSPMAEAIFTHMLEEAGLTDRYAADSAAVSDQETGRPVYPQANAELVRRGLRRSGHRARQLTRGDYARYDCFIGMDQDNVRRMRAIFGGDPDGKIALLLAYTGRPREVEDPWYTGRFGLVYDEIAEGCRALLERLLQDGARRGRGGAGPEGDEEGTRWKA